MSKQLIYNYCIMSSKNKGNIAIWGLIISTIIVWWLIISINKDKIDFLKNKPSILNTNLLEEKNINQIKIKDEISLNETSINENEKFLLNIDNETIKIEDEKEEQIVKELPKEVNLKVQFYPQAPDADWSLPWSEACEEASIILAYYFIKWMDLTKEVFKQEILGIVELEKELHWKYISTNIEETAKTLEEFYDYDNYKIIQNPSIEDLKYELSEWHPIIAPFAWKKLWNIYFKNWWPRYHMLVIVWYKDWIFITNDVWTNRWENFEYTYETIMNALQDLTSEWEFDDSIWKSKVLVLQ